LEYPWLQIHAICADFGDNWTVSRDLPAGKRVVFYPGSTIGNLDPTAAIAFLTRLCDWIGTDGGALLGVDLHKSTEVLNAAYNDAAGITAEFNLNILDRINRLLPAGFERNKFAHRAFYDADQQRIEMHLQSLCSQTVQCNGETVEFYEGETIHTENSYKYTVEGFAKLAEKAGLEIQTTWLDENKLFSVHYLVPSAPDRT
jgi:dimethylhistidine N-methyltransferase